MFPIDLRIMNLPDDIVENRDVRFYGQKFNIEKLKTSQIKGDDEQNMFNDVLVNFASLFRCNEGKIKMAAI